MVVVSDVPNMFWGVTIDEGKRYTQVVERSFHVSMAALEPSSAKPEAVSVMVQHDKAEFLICTLQKGSLFQQPLDLNFTEGEELTFFLNGKGVVHLTGYLIEDDRESMGDYAEMDAMDDMSEDDMASSDEDDDDEDSEEDVPPILKSLKCNLEMADDSDEDESDDEEDEDYSTNKRKKKNQEQKKGAKKPRVVLEQDEDDDDDSEDDEDYDIEDFVADDDDDDDDSDMEDDDEDEDDDDDDEEDDEEEEEEEEVVVSKKAKKTPAKKDKSPSKESPQKAKTPNQKTPKAATNGKATPEIRLGKPDSICTSICPPLYGVTLPTPGSSMTPLRVFSVKDRVFLKDRGQEKYKEAVPKAVHPILLISVPGSTATVFKENKTVSLLGAGFH
ncbi:hypothetical protein CAPTEDRAFT_220209 [Capitella teleta]|uniref:Nucleoplasmin-like domain-containing protein n=1 Tax=Capitella teleta TaxID=283909 RepID=R7TFI7_CAPTE|nr:hypothetical protein CAPTEDRAFT_220209 [Capitella teleta]|eukprot:ELT92262.1 hypothetical protein CAPTEDRAFT_220209 [Capitella teleta]